MSITENEIRLLLASCSVTKPHSRKYTCNRIKTKTPLNVISVNGDALRASRLRSSTIE